MDFSQKNRRTMYSLFGGGHSFKRFRMLILSFFILPGIEIFRFLLLTTHIFSGQLIWLFSRQYDAQYDDPGGAFLT
jgi:hypothetical protein